MTRRRRSIAGLAQPRAPQAKTRRRELKLMPALDDQTAAAAKAAGQTWTAWATEALELALARGSTR